MAGPGKREREREGRVSRRDVLKLGGAALGLALGSAAAVGPGCDDQSVGDIDEHDAAATEADAALGPDAAVPDAAPPDAAPPDALPSGDILSTVSTVVVLMMENRSFDHYFGSLSLREGRAVDGLTGAEFNLDPAGTRVAPFQLDDFTPADPPHGWDDSHDQWNSGANDGFVVAHRGANQNDVMGYHVRSQLPSLYGLADQFALCERWFASVMGSTWPNRFHLHGATSTGIKGNSPAIGFRSIFAALDDAGISNRNYFHDVPWALGGYGKTAGNAPIEQFFTAARDGTLPQFSIVDPGFLAAGANDDHPDHDVRLGQALIASVWNALATSPQWNEILFVITYDEHGGFYDHVPPPTTTDTRADFRQLGFRVPSIVAGPRALRGVVRTPFDHVSVAATVTRRFGVPPLNGRVTATNHLASCLDPGLTAPRPSFMLPPVVINRTELAARARRGDLVVHHPELAAAIDRARPGLALDRRREGLDIALRVLRAGERVGAVQLK